MFGRIKSFFGDGKGDGNISYDQIINIDIESFTKKQGKKLADFNFLKSAIDFGAFSFTKQATEYAYKCFQESFKEGGFYKQGSWKPRKKEYPHPIMRESGDLMRLSKTSGNKKDNIGGHIETTETFGKRKGKKETGYGAVHNDPLPNYKANQHSSLPPVQRQFMGHNEAIYSEISEKYEGLIFDKIFKSII